MTTESPFAHEAVHDIGGVRLHYVRYPNPRPPLVMLHGVTRCWQTYLPILPMLAQRWQVFGFDFRGHGLSAPASDGYHVVEYVREACSFVREVVGRPAVVYGHSLGAMVATGVAAECPDEVLGIVVEDPPYHTMGNRYHLTALASYFEGMRPLAGSSDTLVDLVGKVADLRLTDPDSGGSVRLGDIRDPASLRFQARCLSWLDPKVLEPIVEGKWLEGFDWQEAAGRIRCPVLLLQADVAAGGMLIDEDATLFCKTVKDCTHILYPDANHTLHWARTTELTQHVLQFLETISLEGNE